MKALSLAIALAAGAMIAVPAVTLAQAAPAAAPKVATESPHGLKVGARMPGQYTSTDRFVITEPQAYSLPTPPSGLKWVLVDSTAYLVQDRTDLIVQFRSVTKS